MGSLHLRPARRDLIGDNPLGWVGTRADGTSVVFAGAQPNATYAGQFASLSELDTSDALNTAIAASQSTGPTLSLAQLQTLQALTLTEACAAAIVAGYTSSALGTPQGYPNAATDQLNLIASITASLLPGLPTGWTTPFWCQDPTSGVWALTPHTAVHIEQPASMERPRSSPRRTN